MTRRILELICGTGLLLSTAGALTYVIKDDCPNYVGKASLAILVASGTGLVCKEYKNTSGDKKEPEYYI